MKVFSVLDQPIAKDWILYLWIFSEISIIPMTLGGDGGSILYFGFASVIQYFCFLQLPAAIRRSVRSRKR